MAGDELSEWRSGPGDQMASDEVGSDEVASNEVGRHRNVRRHRDAKLLTR